MRVFTAIACLLTVLASAPAAAEGEPRRADHGDLVVLHVYGSWRDMGRQQVELLGPLAERAYAAYRAGWDRIEARLGTGTRLVAGAALLYWRWLGPRWEESGLFRELSGMAEALGASEGDVVRAFYGSIFGAGSTVFAATGDATEDGESLVGRNVDWPDEAGLRRPVVVHYHPSDGSQDFVIAGWPLAALPLVGLNEAGLAISINYFEADESTTLDLPRIPYRLAMQRARSVDEALRLFREARNQGGAGFPVFADAKGDIALAECLPDACAFFRPEGDWFAHSNHARTGPMIPHDTYRTPDSFRRRAAMENAVRAHRGELTPEVASRILRDRSNSRFVNDSVVANPSVLNAAVIHPASRTLWHATSTQPQAPFGRYLPFSPAGAPEAEPLRADPRYAADGMAEEARVLAAMRQARRDFAQGRLEPARATWDRLAAEDTGILEPSRLALARGWVRFRQGALDEAEAVLRTVDGEDALLEARACALSLRAALADRQGRREDAADLYRRGAALVDAHPAYASSRFFGGLRDRFESGLGAAQDGRPCPTDGDLQRVPG